MNDIGTYRFVASYEGDPDNAAVSTACGDPVQTLTVAPAHSALATTASPTVGVGGALSDAARLTHVVAPGGSITFSLFRPGDETCAGPPVASSTVPVTSTRTDARASSSEYTATAAGTYRWIASYSGDARNLPVSGACGDLGESVTVTDGAPAGAGLSMRMPGTGTIGEPLRATATLSTSGIPSGRITFRFYRPGDDEMPPRCRRGLDAHGARQRRLHVGSVHAGRARHVPRRRHVPW